MTSYSLNGLYCGLSLAVLAFVSLPLAAQQTTTVTMTEVTETIELDGRVEAVQQSTVSAQTSGTIVELPVDVDDAVEAGDLIVRLDDTEQQARLARTQATLASAQATLNDARRRYIRIKDLYQQEVAAQAELDQAQTQFDTAEARVAEARAAFDEADKQLSYTQVRAPYAGIVTARMIELGESVQPGQPLMSGLSLEQLRVITDLPQRYGQYVRRHRQADVITDEGRALTIAAMTFYPYADERAHTFRLRLNLTDPNGTLFPGMLVKVKIAVAEAQAILIPTSALLVRGELRAVYVMNDGERQLRQVRVGQTYGDKIAISAGLQSGERIVVHAETAQYD